MKILIIPINDNFRIYQGFPVNLSFNIFSKSDYKLKLLQTYDESKNRILNNIDEIEKEIKKFSPDLILILYPDLQYIPKNLSKLKIPIVTVFMDWNITSFNYTLEVAKFSDWIFTDHYGVSVLKKIGFKNVSYFPIGGYNQKYFNFENLEKKYDISFIGNLDNKIHSERNRLLSKIINHSHNYNLKIIEGIYLEEHNKFINQSRISFNHSVKGELNMRSYEIMKAKSLLFLEDTNLEVKTIFKPYKHYIPYNEKDLIHKINYFLEDESTRNKIIKNAYEEVEKYTYENNLAILFQKLKKLNLPNNKIKFNSNNNLDKKVKKLKNKLVEMWKTKPYMYFTNVEKVNEIYNDLAVSEVIISEINKTPISLNQVKKYFLESIKELNTINSYNLGYFYKKYQYDYNLSKKYLIKSLDLVNKEKKFKSVCFNYFDAEFRIKWWQILYENINNKPLIIEKQRGYIKAFIFMGLGDLELKQKKNKLAFLNYKKALRSYNFIILYKKMGICNKNLGEYNLAIKYHEKYFEYFPLDTNNLILLIHLLIKTGSNKLSNKVKYTNKLLNSYKPNRVNSLGELKELRKLIRIR